MIEDARTSVEYDPLEHLTEEGRAWYEKVRAACSEVGLDVTTITINESGLVDLKVPGLIDPGPQQSVSDFGNLVLGFLEEAGQTYKDRNAVYQDNFRVVGRVMESLFPNGAPNLHDQHDYNRWHIFELVIVKLTRYVANWSMPDRDSLVDLLPYVSILASLDEELREREERRVADVAHEEALVQRLKDAARGSGLYTSEPVHSEELRRVRESRRQAREDATAPNYEADADDDLPEF